MSIIGNILALPFMALFFATWTLAMAIRPFIVACLLLAMTAPTATLKKMRMTLTAIQYLLFCKDKKWKVPATMVYTNKNTDDPVEILSSKTIIFVRHGESTWNDTFNKGDRSLLQFILYFIPGLLKSIAMECYFFVTGQAHNSWFYDSPLSDKGLTQARNLSKFLAESTEYKTPREQQLIRLMHGTGTETDSQLLSSNLRRAISTLAVAFPARLQQKKPGDSIIILSELQEISSNPDALTILTSKESTVQCAWTDPPFLADIFKHQINMTLSNGNKAIDSNGFKRMQAFCAILFNTDIITKDAVIAVGHSLWFRSFFQTYLPNNIQHVAKKKKLINGGCVGFVIHQVKTKEGMIQYRIDPKSITVLYGGF